MMLGLHVSVLDYQRLNVTLIHSCIHTYVHSCIHTYVHSCIRTYVHSCIRTYVHSCIRTYVHSCVVLFGHNLLLALHPSLQALLADPGLKDGFNMATRIIQTFQLPVEDVLCHMAKALVLASRYQDVKDLLHLMQLTDVCPESSSDKIIISAVKTLSHHTKDVRCYVLYSPSALVSEFVDSLAQPDHMYHSTMTAVVSLKMLGSSIPFWLVLTETPCCMPHGSLA